MRSPALQYYTGGPYPPPPLPPPVGWVLRVLGAMAAFLLLSPLFGMALLFAANALYEVAPVLNPTDREVAFSGWAPLPAEMEDAVRQDVQRSTIVVPFNDLPAGCDCRSAYGGEAHSAVRYGEGYVLSVHDRAKPKFRDRPYDFQDVRVLDRRGNFVRQYGNRALDLNLFGVTSEGDLIVESGSRLFKVAAAAP